MPFVGTEFVNVVGASNAAAGQTVQSSVWNAIHIDQEDALTQLNSQYSTVSTNRNIMWMNGGFEVWQRGAGASASFAFGASTSTFYTADRWYLINGAGQACTVSAQAGLVSESQVAGKYQRNSGQTGTGTMALCYPIDTDELIRMRGNKVTLSFLVKGGTNFSAGSVNAVLYTGTAAGGPTKALANGAGFTGLTTNLSVTTTVLAGQTVLVTATSSNIVQTNITQAEVQIRFTPSGTAGVDDSITIDDVSLEAVTTAYSEWTTMSYDRVPFYQMLEGCKRFYQKTFNYNTAPANALAGSSGSSTRYGNVNLAGLTQITTGLAGPELYWNYPVELRRNPTVIDYTLYNPIANVGGTVCFMSAGNVNVAPSAETTLTCKTLGLNFLGGATDGWIAAHITISADIL